MRTLAAKARDLRYMSANAYTRLVGYDEKLQPAARPLLETVENEDDRIFTFTLREGHRWSDGIPFTTEDFRYYWEDIALNKELSPTGPPEIYDRRRQAAARSSSSTTGASATPGTGPTRASCRRWPSRGR